MADEKMSVVLASNGIKQLSQSLNLTKEQIQKASSSALQLQSNSNLRNCSSLSIAKYCFETARYNFTRDDAVYPVPYGGSIQAQVGYKGYIELALRSGKYSKVNASKVLDCDTINVDEDTGEVVVKFNTDIKARKGAKVVGYYAYAKDHNDKITDKLYMSVEECLAHGKKYSKTFSGLWTNEPDKMCLKTVIKQLCKTLDQTPELKNAIELDQKVLGANDGYFDNPNTNTTIQNTIDFTDDTGEVVETEKVENNRENPDIFKD